MKQILSILFVFQIYNGPAYSADWPKPDFNSCEFYNEAENILKCESHGSDYLKGYGLHYCNRFKESGKNWTGKLKNWVEGTGQCLQEMLYDNKAKRLDSCENMTEFAFDVHPICYKQYGICDLSLQDYWTLLDFLRAVDITNTATQARRSKTQFNNVYEACVERLKSKSANALFEFIADQIDSLSKNLRKMAGEVFILAPKDDQRREKYFLSALAIILFDSSSSNDLKVAQVYSKEYASQQGNVFEARKNSLQCLSDLRSGIQNSSCNNKADKFYVDEKLKEKAKIAKPKVTENKLRKIIQLSKSIAM